MSSPPQQSPQTQIQHKPNTLFVGGISWKATEENLKECFSKYGEVAEVKIIRDKFNFNQSKGYGFVTFADAEGSEKAKQEGFVTLMNKTMNVGDAYRGGTRGDAPNSQQAPRANHNQPRGGMPQGPPHIYQNYQTYPQHFSQPHIPNPQYNPAHVYDPQQQQFLPPQYQFYQQPNNPYYHYYYAQQQQYHQVGDPQQGIQENGAQGVGFENFYNNQNWSASDPQLEPQQQ
ncbi:boule-like protein [Acrasis kona]|uniref:Boule-like protein n=1 Tax=Acrasis kona TaxID=1008807 RepID=A0AAW2Z9R3_9EUKA